VRHQNDDCLQTQFRRNIAVGTALEADRMCGPISHCKVKTPWKKQKDGREDQFDRGRKRRHKCHTPAGPADPHFSLYARSRMINMDLVLLFSLQHGDRLVLSYFDYACRVSTRQRHFPVSFHNTRLAFARLTTLGAGLLVAALLLCAPEARVHSYVQDTAILADPSRIHSRSRGKLPFLPPPWLPPPHPSRRHWEP
jgi:hypothetical protein